ncbi:MAG: helix-turn-helix domain-containing protein, partial [Rhizobiales bacterium]|nr:helix-turn-helix domain-containing protein [Hyphomicrobiales bacterium]
MDQILLQLDEARDWMVTLGRKTASEKVASFLILLLNHIAEPAEESDQKARFELPITRGDMADFLGLTLETVSRQLTKLRKAGLISFDDSRHVVIEKRNALLTASGE